jgi:hypothetical protein
MSAARCYQIPQLLEMLQISRRRFEELRAAGKLPFLEELQPRIGRPRYRADLVDAYFAGTFRRPMLAARVRPIRKAG